LQERDKPVKAYQDRLLKWAVAFAERSLDDAAGIRKELRSFLAGPFSPFIAVPDTDVSTVTDDELPALQSDVAAVLARMIDHDMGGGILPSITVEKAMLAPRENRGKKTRRGAPAQPLLLAVIGPIRDVFLEMFFQLLLTDSAQRVRRCPGCRKFFVKTGRSTHCTSTCYDSTYWASLPPETKERYRRRQYEKMGWTRGARLQRIATESLTGGKKKAQRKHAATKNPPIPTRGKRRA
jgi:hypothetical protein